MRAYACTLGGLLAIGALILVVGCAQDEPVPTNYRDLGGEPGEVLVPYEPVPDHKVTEDPSQFPLPAPAAPLFSEQPVVNDSAAAASQVVQNLAEGQYEQVVALFDETMAAQLPAAQLQSIWEGVTVQAGALQEQGEPQVEQVQPGQTAVTVPVMFENGVVNVLVVFDGQGNVAGLNLQPVPTDGAAPAEGAAESSASPTGASTPAGQRNSGSGSFRGREMLPPAAPAPIGIGN